MDLKVKLPIIVSVILAGVYCFLAQDNVFFWDTVQLGAKQGLFFFEHDFSQFILPTDIDSGHPPIFGFYLALIWKIIGDTSLQASHWAMFPFLVLFFYYWYQLITHFTDYKFGFIAFILTLTDPTLSSQFILVSPDIVVASMFVSAVYGVLRKKHMIITLSSLLLTMVSLRGMMIVASLYFFTIILDQKFSFKHLIQKAYSFVPAGLFALVFLIYHYIHTGWIGHHDDSPWAPSFQIVDFNIMLKNIALFLWRLFDFGRIIIWLFISIAILRYGPKTLKIKPQLILFFTVLIFLSPSFILHNALSAHRYLLPLMLVGSLVFATIFYNLKKFYKFRLFGILSITFLFMGNFWIYPDHISQGWDSTLAHVPYYKQRNELIQWIDEKDIPIDSIGTVFPEIGPLKFRNLSTKTYGFKRLQFDQDNYVFYSNIMNDFTDDQYEKLNQYWEKIYSSNGFGVKIILYKRPN